MQRGTRRGEVELALQAADQALDRVNAGEALRDLVAGHAASIQAFLLRSPALIGEKPEKLIALSQEAQQLLPEEEKAIRSVNALNIGYGYMALADLQAAELAYKQTLEDGLAGGNFYAAIYGPINLVMIALLAGRLKEALHLCETYIERFNKILAGQNFPPIGALYILKGSILLEYNRLAEAEPVLMEGLDLIRWTGEYEAHNTGYTALARLRAIQGDRPAMLEAVKTLEEAWPEGVFYAQALRHRLSMRHWPDDPDVQKDAQTWLAQSGIEFEKLAVIHSVDPMSTGLLRELSWRGSRAGAPGKRASRAHTRLRTFTLTWSASRISPQPMGSSAGSWKSPSPGPCSIRLRGRRMKRSKRLEVALRAAAPTGLFRIFVDECEPLQALLEELKPRLADEALIAYANRLLEAFSCGPAKPETGERHEALLSERELEVLRYLARGLTYEEIGQQLFLSLNTVQFHVKNIYGKLLVNKRVQAIEKAREMNLI